MIFYLVIIILLGVIIGQFIHFILYRRQIHSFCDQLFFHRKETTNKEISIDLRAKEIKQLQKELNLLYESMRARENEYQQEEQKIKQLITNISHDIRTPLTSISGYFQMLSETTDEAEQERYRSIICGRIRTMNDMLEELFSYTKIQNEENKKEEKLCDIRQILCETLFLFYDEIKEKNLEPVIDVPEEKVLIYGIEEDLNRIFLNILKNAMVHGEKIVKVRLTTSEQWAIISIENKTNETLPDHVEEVFERFYRGNIARSTQSSGLGLCIAKELTESMHGTIAAYSKEPGWFGIETGFLIYHPVKEL